MAKSTAKKKVKKNVPKGSRGRECRSSVRSERSGNSEILRGVENLLELHKLEGAILRHLKKKL